MGWAVVLLAVAGVAPAFGLGAVRARAEASMLVTGTIDIEEDGWVSGHLIDREEALPPGVAAFVGQAASGWRFEPVLVDGSPVKARTPMSLRVVARKEGESAYKVDIRGASFGNAPAGEFPSRVDMKPPKYPYELRWAGVSGTVYLVLRLGPHGQVEDVVTEQVNLRTIARERQMERFRDLMANASLMAAKSWTFAAPAEGPAAGETGWTVRVPVDFHIYGERQAGYGQWEAYVPGPRQGIPWMGPEVRGFSPDALAAGGVYPLEHHGPRLLTELDGA